MKKHLDLEVGKEAAEIKVLDAKFIKHKSEEKLTKTRNFSSFTEIRDFFDIPIISKTEQKINKM